jgi:hypothetical protein
MVNWAAGTYTNPTPSGACTGASANTIEKTGAGWVVNALVNWMVRITSGAGIGQVANVASNTATIITIVGTWGITPSVGDTFEIVLKFLNNDHITGNVILSNGVITELEDSAIILFDGAYSLTLQDNCTVRWAKSKSTFVTFQPNNITVQGVAGFWRYIRINSTLSVKPYLSYLKLKCASEGIYLQPSATLGNGHSIFNIWSDNAGSNSLYLPSTAITENFRLKNWLVTNSYNATFSPSLVASAFDEVFDTFWIEDNHSATIVWGYASCPLRQIIRNSVWKRSWYNAGGNIDNANKQIKVMDSYTSTWTTQGCWARNTNAGAGSYYFSRNWSNMSREIFCTTALSLVNIISRFNDFVGQAGVFKSHEITAGLGVYTSDNDYISGRLGAPSEHIDLSAAVASTESPAQYGTLSSPRTNPKSARNMLLECDNVVVSAIGLDCATVTFDSKNSHIGTTVNGDSNTGTAVLFVASTTDFEEDEIIEIGEGTARYEEGEILSINPGVSVTLKANLAYTHLAADADQARKVLRHIVIPFVAYGLVSGAYRKQTFVPPTNRWGEIYTDFTTLINGVDYAFKRRGHNVTLLGLEPGTKYFFVACGYNPMEEYLVSTEYTFTTLSPVAGGAAHTYRRTRQPGLLGTVG